MPRKEMSVRWSAARRPVVAIGVWCAQLVAPTVGLVYVGSKIGSGGPLGVYSLSLLGLSLAWYTVCIGLVCAQSFRAWVRVKMVALIALYLGVVVGLAIAEGFVVFSRSAAMTASLRSGTAASWDGGLCLGKPESGCMVGVGKRVHPDRRASAFALSLLATQPPLA